MMTNEEYLCAKETAKQLCVSVGEIIFCSHFAQAVDAIGAKKPHLKELILDGKSGMTQRQVIIFAEMEY